MSESSNVKLLPIDALKPGMVIIKVTEQNGPIKIKKSGLVTSIEMVQGLIEMGIQQVQVDLDQTVEIESSATTEIKQSATQKMLTDAAVANTRIDDGLSSQFHRSLFLPTVQDLPSAWQYYFRRYGIAVLIAIGGFGIGWSGANIHLISELVASKTSPSAPSQEAALPAVEATQVEPQVQNTVKSGDDANLASTQKQNVPEVTNIIDSPVVEDVASVSQQIAAVPAAAPVENTPRISSELLNKFNKALSQVTDESPTSIQNSASSREEEDVPRVDQLPAWVLTELPSMSFSAHMYASDIQERWVRVNGSRMVEGDMIDNKVQIVLIEPQRVILTYAGHEFAMDALTDW